MKISCNKTILVEALTNVSRVTLGKSSLKVLEGVLFKAQDNKLYLSGYDLETGIATSIDAVVLEEGDVVLNARTALEIIRKGASERIEIDCDDKFNVKITAGKAEFKILGIPSIEYPELPTYNEIGNFTISQSKLKSMIMQTLYATSQDNDRPILKGTLFDLLENMLCLVSVDGSRLAVRREEIVFDDTYSFIVPGKALAEISKLLLDEDKDISISFGRKQINFVFNDYKVMSRLIEGDFIDYNRIIPTDNTLSLRVKTREFVDSVERLSSLNTEKAKAPIRCSFKDNQINFTCTTTIGQGKDVINCEEMQGDEMELGFNSRNLIDAFKNSELDEVLVELKNSTSPMTIKLGGLIFSFIAVS